MSALNQITRDLGFLPSIITTIPCHAILLENLLCFIIVVNATAL